MGEMTGKKMPHGLKKWLLRVYNRVLNIPEFIEKQYTKIYSKLCRVKPKKVVFSNFFGRPYGDNPKYITEELRARCPEWDMVWLLSNTALPLPEGVRAVQFGSWRAIREMASAKFLVFNIRNIYRPKKKNGQVYLQTWHGGLAFKACEGAVPNLNPVYVKAAKLDGENCDGIISSCGLRTEEYRKYFWLNQSTEILETGLPRNDKLFDSDTVRRAALEVRKTLRIAENKKIVLYMPTFRDDRSVDGYKLDHQGVLDAFEKRFGGEFVMAVRLHPNVQDQADLITYGDWIVNATQYPDAQELYMAADYLITDYSSAAFDFALLDRPVFLCALDHEKYSTDRGLTDIFQQCPFPRAYTNSEMVQCVEDFSQEEYEARFVDFGKKWRPFDRGDAAQRIVDWMISKNK